MQSDKVEGHVRGSFEMHVCLNMFRKSNALRGSGFSGVRTYVRMQSENSFATWTYRH